MSALGTSASVPFPVRLLRALQALFAHRQRVPVLLQLSATECGATCLAMILGYFGRKTSIAECRDACSVGRDGISAQTIAAAARSYGLRVHAYSIEPADLKHVPLPAIAHWNFNHFVVIERWSPRTITIVDPAAGRRRITTAEFDASFTGVVLTFEPGAQFERRRTTVRPSLTRYLLGFAAQTPGILGQVLAASLFLQLLGLTVPVLTQVLVDRVLPYRLTGIMPVLAIGMFVLVLAQTVATYLRSALLVYLQGKLDSQMMVGFVDHLLALPFRFFQERTSGDLLMRLGSNSIIRDTLSSQTISVILDGGLVVGYLAILLVREPILGLLALTVGLLQAGLLLGTTRWMHGLMQRDLAAQAEAQAYLVEALQGIATLKASGAEDRVLDRWSNLFYKELNISLRRSHLSAVLDTASTALRAVAPLLLLWVGALRVLDGSMSLGTMLALNALAASVLTPLVSLASTGKQLQLVAAYFDRLTDVLTAEPEQEAQDVQAPPALTGRIELRNVSFRYDRNAPPVLREISLAIEPGQKVALVGATGSGKSTLAMLLLGLYHPTEGEILYDGIPLSRLSYRSLRSQLGVVLQESFLFSGSIRQNIAFNNPAASLTEIVEAARRAGIHDTIMQMPMGYETLVAEGGSGLSGGQRQCLSIARALASNPAILLLDEATSHLDVLTEALVDRNLSDLACTRIVIAHRLSTIRNADLILVLDEGRIVERGTHDELLVQNGRYAALVRGQAQTNDTRTSLGNGGGEYDRLNGRNGHAVIRRRDLAPIETTDVSAQATVVLRQCRSCGHTLRGRYCTMCGERADTTHLSSDGCLEVGPAFPFVSPRRVYCSSSEAKS